MRASTLQSIHRRNPSMNRTSICSAARFCVLALITSTLLSLSTFAQDAGQVLQLSVSFRTLKNRTQMSDEKRQQVEALEVKIPDLPDGNYQIVVKLSPKNEELLYKSNPIRIARDVNAQAGLLKMRAVMFRTDLEKRIQIELLAALPAAEYAASMIDLINAGQLSVERTDLKAEIANANSLLDQIAKGENPLQAKRGDIHWAYRSAVDQT